MTDLTGQSIGRYHILEQLGQGGMATVYKAYDTHLERDVAVKVIRREAFGQEILDRVLKRFEREAKTLAKLTHPNIVSIIDNGDYEGSPYLVMPYLQGGTLKQYLVTVISWQEAIRLLLPILSALAYAHKQGVIHRDIKPANILITASGEPMLTDFGIAKILELNDGQTLTGTGLGVGTPEYMPPEQGLGKEIDQRADIYALGVVFYELITGTKPYSADTPMAVIFKHISDPLPRPSEIVPDIPEEVERVVFKALAKKPDDRYADMAAFSTALEKLVRNNPGIGPDQKHRLDSIVKPTAVESLPETRDDLASFIPTLPTQHDKPTKRLPGKPGWIVVSLIGLALLVWLFISTILPGFERSQAQPSTNTANLVHTVQVETANSEKTAVALAAITDQTATALLWTATPKVTATSTSTPTLAYTPTPTFGIGSTRISEIDGMEMVYVPAGDFIMGNDMYDDTKPVHTVYLDAYWIDKYEVTNAQYRKCVEQNTCDFPKMLDYYDNPDFDNHPVISLSWSDAMSYCDWAERRLPTEAEWEKAARGPNGNIYPWGNSYPEISIANISSSVGGTTKVGSYPDGASYFGVQDMAGNVDEWVQDWYEKNYYSEQSEWNNPKGPRTGTYKVLRGGSWINHESKSRSYYREGGFPWIFPGIEVNGLGVRCSLSLQQ